MRFVIICQVVLASVIPLGLAPAAANPLGAQVVGGNATVQGQGTANVTVTQATDRAIINWNTFNIGSNEKTQFVQPNSSSIALNRVTGGLGPSQIFGSLSANGRIFLVNPDGILVGPGAKIDTAGFLATTHDIANADFMAGRYNFSIPGRPDASVVNRGVITAQNGGFAALVAPGVRNSGTITARLGKITLASGNAFTLDFYGDKLITLGVTDSIAASVKDVATGQPLRSLVSNQGKLKANGGIVELTAVAARKVVDSVINNKGVIEANSIGTRNGMIVLSAATAKRKPKDAPTQTVNVAGKLSAAGKRKGQTGGTIEVTGEAITLASATVDASGRSGGGTVLIGGDVGGGNPSPAAASIGKAALQPYTVPTASTVTVDNASKIDASAKDTGDGGKVVVWADGSTAFNGSVSARGGAEFGNGGFVETSGHRQLSFNGTVDLHTFNGTKGTLLLDPLDARIDTAAGPGVITVSALQSALSGDNIVRVTTDVSGIQPGDITVAANVSWSSASTLELYANRNITINDGVIVKNTGNGTLSLYAGIAGDPNGVQHSTGTGTVSFLGSANVDFLQSTGVVHIVYNPPNGYGNPTNFNNAVHVNPGALIAPLFVNMWVNNVNDLQNINQNLSGRYELGQNIDASATANWNGGAGFIPIGSSATPFNGTFEGLGYTINGLKINSNAFDVGLFGVIGPAGNVERVGLTNISVTGGIFTGGLAGHNDGTIYQSFVTGTVTSRLGAAGGLVGINGEIGGSNAIIQSYSSASVVHTMLPGPPGETGGLVGQNNALIDASYSTGSTTESAAPVFQERSVGGLVGHNNGVVLNSYATGLVTGINTDAAGLIGSNSALSGSLGPTSVIQSYWDKRTTGQQNDGAPVGIGVFSSTGLTTTQLKAGLRDGFDPTVWAISANLNSGYPHLIWQESQSSFIGRPLVPVINFLPSSSTPTTIQPSLASSALDFFNSQYTNNLTGAAPINTTVAGSTPPIINTVQPTISTNTTTTPQSVNVASNSSTSGAGTNVSGCPDQINCGFLKQDNIEGYLSYPYIKMDDFGVVAEKSGVAIGLGIDFGSGRINAQDFSTLPDLYQKLYKAVAGKSGHIVLDAVG